VACWWNCAHSCGHPLNAGMSKSGETGGQTIILDFVSYETKHPDHAL